MAKIATGVKVFIETDAKQFIQATDRIEKRSSKTAAKLEGGFKKVGAAIAAAFAVKEVGRFALETAKLAASLTGVHTAFKKLKGYPGLMDRLKEATRGTVSEVDLMKKSVQAANFGIPLEALAKGLEFATKRAAETGESVDYLVDSFVTGLGRKSVMILDNLGISASKIREEVKKTGDFSSAVIKITNDELKKMGEVTVTDAQKMQQLKAEWEDFKGFLGGFTLKFVMPIVNGLKQILGLADIQAIKQKKEEQRLRTLITVATLYKKGTDERAKAIANLKKEYPEYFKYLKEEEITNEKLQTILKDTNAQLLERLQIYANSKYIENRMKAMGDAQQRQADIGDRINKITKKLGVETKDINQFLKDNLKVAHDFYSYGPEAAKGMSSETAKLIIQLDEELNSFKDVTKEIAVYGNEINGAKNRNEELNKVIAQQNDELLTTTNQLRKRKLPKMDLAPLITGMPDMKRIRETLAMGIAKPIQVPIKPEIDIDSYSAQLADMTSVFKRNLELQAKLEAEHAEEVRQLKIGITQETLSAMQNFFSNYMSFLDYKRNKDLQAAGNDNKRKLAIEKKYYEKQKKMSITQALINGALAVTNILATVPGGAINPLAWVAIGLTAATTAAQVALMSAQKFASGGIVSGPTTAIVGEYPNAKSNPEVIAPLDKLENLLSKSVMNGQVVFRIDGEDLVGVLNNYNTKINNY